MTLGQVRDDLLGLVGVDDPTFATPVLLNRILADINATLQKLWSMAPPWWSAATSGAFLHAPAGVGGLTVTKAATTLTTSSQGTLPTWSEGCTIRLAGDPTDNVIVRRDGANTTVELALPYAGPSGSGQTATIYCDAVTLPATIISVLAPVVLTGEHELSPQASPRGVLAAGQTSIAEPRDVASPRSYYVERATAPNGRVILRLRFTPLPEREYVVNFQAMGEPPQFTNLQAQAAELVPVPAAYTASIFMPMVRNQFSTWKHFESAGIRDQLKQQYMEAFQLLGKLKPQPMQGRAVAVSGNW